MSVDVKRGEGVQGDVSGRLEGEGGPGKCQWTLRGEGVQGVASGR